LNLLFYNLGTLISNNSLADEWVYIVRSGSCRVIKTVLINENARKNYINSQHRREHSFMKVLGLNENLNKDKINCNYYNLLRNSDRNYTGIKIRLEIEDLKEGDIFGIRDLVFSDFYDYNPVAMISDGAECILIDRKQFRKNLNEISISMLKISLMPYPNDEYYLRKYFDKEDWKNFKKTNLLRTIDKINLNR
jgi:hypothetical protein